MRLLLLLPCIALAMGDKPAPAAPVAIVTTAKIAFTPSTVAPGASSTLSWSSTNASSCALASGGLTKTVPTSGSMSTGPVTKTAVTAITCSGATASATLTVVVSPPPPPKPTDPPVLPPNEPPVCSPYIDLVVATTRGFQPQISRMAKRCP